MKWALALLTAGVAMAQADFDLLLKGGHVIDPRNKISAVRDVAIKDGRIAAVAAEPSVLAGIENSGRVRPRSHPRHH